MILVSCRRDFSDTRHFSARNVIRNYPSFPKLEPFLELDRATLADQMHGRHVLILVHGFRNPLRSVATAYQRVLKGLIDNDIVGENAYELVLGFAWPGFATALGFLPAVPFANRSAGFFRSLLELASRNARSVDVQTHSLGARVALQTLGGETKAFVDNLLLTAPAVDDEVLEPLQEFDAALDLCRRCLVYHSERDGILRFAFRVGDAPEFDRALGWKGPQHPAIIAEKRPGVLVIDCKKAVSSHGAYKSAPEYYAHWHRVVHELPLAQFETLKGPDGHQGGKR
jgi:esterase/lipase superfamily enzyme